jgi:hypothetical protein
VQHSWLGQRAAVWLGQRGSGNAARGSAAGGTRLGDLGSGSAGVLHRRGSRSAAAAAAAVACVPRAARRARSPASRQSEAEVIVFPAHRVVPFWEATCCFRRSSHSSCHHSVHVAGRVHGATLNRLSHGVAKSLYKKGLSAPLQSGLPNLGRTCYLGVAALTSTPTPTH